MIGLNNQSCSPSSRATHAAIIHHCCLERPEGCTVSVVEFIVIPTPCDGLIIRVPAMLASCIGDWGTQPDDDRVRRIADQRLIAPTRIASRAHPTLTESLSLSPVALGTADAGWSPPDARRIRRIRHGL